ncbi:MAG: CTP synthase [Verrucomicrobia bacterium]|nr:CTP synthase [Verrucomicrobiota bacterium]
MPTPTIALVGDYSTDVPAHRAIPIALELAAADLGRPIASRWVHTSELHDAPAQLADCTAIWVVPASPYANMAGALAAIRFARETKRPFLGTCGGFQHALIEYARNVLGLTGADHAETNPTATTLVVTPLSCSLVEATGTLHLAPGSLIRSAYGRDTVTEGYRCNYGPAPVHRAAFERAGLRFTAFDESGEIRAAELPVATHPFFVGTLFQPERAALRGKLPPLICAFIAKGSGL